MTERSLSRRVIKLWERPASVDIDKFPDRRPGEREKRRQTYNLCLIFLMTNNPMIRNVSVTSRKLCRCRKLQLFTHNVADRLFLLRIILWLNYSILIKPVHFHFKLKAPFNWWTSSVESLPNCHFYSTVPLFIAPKLLIAAVSNFRKKSLENVTR